MKPGGDKCGGGLTLLEAQVGDFVDGGSVVLHEDVELVQEQLLLGVGEPAALPAHLHAAHHVLLQTRNTPPSHQTADESQVS